MIGDELRGLTEDVLLQGALDQVSDDIDKSQGSIIYDTLAPICHIISDKVIGGMIQTYLDNNIVLSSGTGLDLLVAQFGLTRVDATYAEILVTFTTEHGWLTTVIEDTIKKGTKIRTKSSVNQIEYEIIDNLPRDPHLMGSATQFIARCTQKGTVGNNYGTTMMLSNHIDGIIEVNGVGLYTSARDVETDEELKERLIDFVKAKGFAGNIQSYQDWVRNGDLEGVGAIQVFPVQNEFTNDIMLMLVDNDYRPITDIHKMDEYKKKILGEYDDWDGSIVMRGKGNGLAPIGATIQIFSPVAFDNIKFDIKVNLHENYTVEDIQSTIKKDIMAYLLEELKEWDNYLPLTDSYKIQFRYLKIMSICENSVGVDSVPEITITDLFIRASHEFINSDWVHEMKMPNPSEVLKGLIPIIDEEHIIINLIPNN